MKYVKNLADGCLYNFLIILDWTVCIYLTQLYDGRDMYRIFY